MQLTKLDHWLKQKFVYRAHIFSLRLPDSKLPRAVKVEEIEVKKQGDYKYKLVIKNNNVANNVIAMLKEEHIMHAARIVNGSSRFGHFVMPSGGRSFTYLMIGRLLVTSLILTVGYHIYKLIQNETFISKLQALWEELKIGM